MPGLLEMPRQPIRLGKPKFEVDTVEINSLDSETDEESIIEVVPSKLVDAADYSTYWWSLLGPALQEMLTFADYSPAQRDFYCDFYRRVLCPAMGEPISDCAMRYRGCLTSDGTPIEYSFSWDRESAAAPDVRFSIDPDATSRDISSVENTRAILAQLGGLAACHGLDTSSWAETLFKHFCLSPNIGAERVEDILLKAGHKSQVMLGFDLKHSNNAISTKIYFLPCLQAAYHGTTRWQVVHEAMAKIATASSPSMCASLVPQIAVLQSHIASYPKSLENNVRYLSLDLVRPEKARMKVYVRAPGETFDEIWDFFSVHGHIPYSASDKAAIRELYSFVAEDDAASINERGPGSPQDGTTTLESTQQKTAPFRKSHICYFVLQHGRPTLASKLFIRVQRPFAQSDLAVAQGLEKWFKRSQWLSEGVSWRYTNALRTAFPHQDLEADGMHCWIAVSIKKSQLTVESYLSPEVYKQQYH